MFLYFTISTILILLVFAGSLFGAPWVPTRKVDYERIDKLANLKDGEKLYDLGCGLGGVLFYLSERHKNSKFIGIEIAPFPYLFAKLRSLFYQNVRIKFGDLKRQNLSSAKVVYMFLTPDTHNKLKIKLIRELKPEAKIITACWGFDYDSNAQVDKAEKQVSYFVYTAGEVMNP
jgi:SAM-dependent methyltransferase